MKTFISQPIVGGRFTVSLSAGYFGLKSDVSYLLTASVYPFPHTSLWVDQIHLKREQLAELRTWLKKGTLDKLSLESTFYLIQHKEGGQRRVVFNTPSNEEYQRHCFVPAGGNGKVFGLIDLVEQTCQANL